MENQKKKESAFNKAFVTRTSGFIDVSRKRHFWQELADELEGELRIVSTVSYDLEKLKLDLHYNNSSIRFTESDTHPLKINCELVAKQPCEFSICYEDNIEKLLKFFGQQDIQVGDEEFDNKYLIQEKKTKYLEQILSDSVIRQIMLRNNVFSFRCTYEKKENILALSTLVSRTVSSKEELEELYKMFCHTIDALKNLDVCY